MRTSPGPVKTKMQCDSEDMYVDDAFRTLVGLIEKSSAAAPSSDSGGENVLVDTEVEGARYLLVRMPQAEGVRVQLSPREQEIVRMVAKGHPNKVIADVLNISAWIVCTHMRRIFAKLGVGSRAAMIARLLELGILNRRSPTEPS